MQLITKEFEKQALAFPSRVEQALAQIETVAEAKDMLDKASVMSDYAKRLKAGVEIEKPIAKGVLKIKAKLGELMPAKSNGGRGKKTVELVDGLSRDTIAAYRKLADHADRLEEYVEQSEDVPTQTDFLKFATGKYNSGTQVGNNSGENEWYTPAEHVLLSRSVMGGIDLDPASSDVAQKVVQAETYYTIADDGLQQPWAGRVWMNPPYAKGLVEKFMEKLAGHVVSGEVTQAIVLINNATETKWFQSCGRRCAAACFPSGRIQFHDKTGEKKNSPLQGQVFLYFGKRTQRFCEAFDNRGLVFRFEGSEK